ncbi:hypothetical protein KC19_8G073800 [Ceratodon purpureus]|uniref:Enoyl reductase (ER) domain-containing protein n=1 Tax=Ceratodon purpureus TaxID=3225 RepID=A0A8T0GZK5_CERPU|nr:hypothetical protein KC19_8G073800 [Ceratodon purpureus]
MANVAIVQDGYDAKDPLSTLKLVTKPIPKPAPGQVVVHIILRPVNPTDLITLRTGAIANGGVAGSEGYGIVYEVGEGVTKLHKGQRVIPFTAEGSQSGTGSFQKYVCIDAHFVWPVPDYISDEVAAQFVINPWTSYSLLKDLQVPKGQYMIQSAAGSVLGRQVISLAKHWGIKSINVVRRSEQKAELKALGADEVIVSSEEDIVARAKEITGGKGVYGALDPVCGTTTGTLASCVRNGGQIFVYGVLSGFSATVSVVDLFRDVSVTGWGLYTKATNDPKKCLALATEVAPLVRDGIIPVAEVEKYDLTDFKKAMVKADEPARSVRVLLVSA